jgi:hypothetical protein
MASKLICVPFQMELLTIRSMVKYYHHEYSEYQIVRNLFDLHTAMKSLHCGARTISCFLWYVLIGCRVSRCAMTIYFLVVGFT